jgi:galactonate dehydratase
MNSLKDFAVGISGAAMIEITDIQAYSVAVSVATNWMFLRVSTRAGLVGWGEMTLRAHEPVLHAVVEQLRPQIIGLPISALSKLRRAFPSLPSGRAGNAVLSALDQALCDIEGQALGLSIYAAHGAVQRSLAAYATVNRSIRERTPRGFAQAAADAVAAGFRGVKVMPFDRVMPATADDESGLIEIATAVSRLEAVREVIGPGVALMADCHWRLSHKAALKFLDAIAPLRLEWLECPTPEGPDWLDGLMRLRRAANGVGVKLAGGENAVGVSGLFPAITAGVYDIVMPDIKYCGGYGEFVRIAELANRFNVAISPHNPSGPIAHIHTLHLCTILELSGLVEQQFAESDLFERVVDGAAMGLVQGCFIAPPRPGIGVKVCETTLSELPGLPGDLNISDPGFA